MKSLYFSTDVSKMLNFSNSDKTKVNIKVLILLLALANYAILQSMSFCITVLQVSER